MNVIDADDYIKQLEETIKAFLQPVKNIPFPLAIRVIFGHNVIPFNPKDSHDQALLDRLKLAITNAGLAAYHEGIFSKRPNEAGNYIEPFVKKALHDIGTQAETPRTETGSRKASGYPDIIITDIDGRISYLECKTYNAKSKNSTFRAFYFSPHSKSGGKITHDARHFIATFELTTEQRKGRSAFVPLHWAIYSLDSNFRLNVKHEFNASNKALYQPVALLAEGSIV